MDTIEQVIETTVDGFSKEEKIYFVYNGKVVFKVKPYSGLILKKKIYWCCKFYIKN